ncbi:hypothetical protein [Fluviicola taffensis]|uniref:hypothetical protein n=1 Tax=Fluviicola taffensis TaxID=191579 RepID=UPI003137B5E4
MKNIILGNGINIQFGGIDNTNKLIVSRALMKLKSKKYNKNVYTEEIEIWITLLYHAFPDFINGDYDYLAVLNDEKKELINFKKRYTKRTLIDEIGFEDFFLLSNLYCRKNKIVNPERFYIQEFLRRLFLDSIFNDGKVNLLHENFPSNFINFLNSYDNIFTSNYDRNLEIATKREILYLHGAFHVLAHEYDHNSFRNQLSDKPIKNAPVIQGYEHVFSTALTSNSGALKKHVGESPELANSAIDKFAKAYLNNHETKREIESWKDDNNYLVRNLYEGIKLKIKNSDLNFSIDYALNHLKNISGSITFMGLSPNNDDHIISLIKNNQAIDLIEYYYFDKSEGEIVMSLFEDKKVLVKDIKEFWNKTT